MRKYFELCEQQWMQQKGRGFKFKYFRDASQLELFPPDVCRQARGYLDEAAKLAQSEVVKWRVQLYSEGFRMTELYATFYHGEASLSRLRLNTKEDVKKALQLLKTLFTVKDELPIYMQKVIMSNNLHCPAGSPFETEAAQYTPRTRALPALEKVIRQSRQTKQWEWAKKEFLTFAGQLGNNDDGLAVKVYIETQDHPERLVEAVKNASFEETSVIESSPTGIDWVSKGAPPCWRKWTRPGTKVQLLWTNEAAHTGKSSVKIAGAESAVFLQSVKVQPGQMCVASVFAKGKVSSRRNKTGLGVKWQDADGKWVEKPSVGDQLAPGETQNWILLSTFFIVPEGVYRAVIMLGSENQCKGDYVFFDDVSLKQMQLE